jgi:RNA polymerase sigma factor (sigma-70 family)
MAPLGTQPSHRLSGRVQASWSTLRLYLRARDGDRTAVSALFARHWTPLVRWAHGRLPTWARSRLDTVDLVQETMLHTFRRLDGFEVRRRSALKAYLQQGIQNRIRDELRHLARAPRAALSDDLIDSRPTPLDQAIARETEERYKHALSRLSAREQELIVGRFELDYSFEQLALATRRRSAAAARVALSRAVARLAGEMDRG